MPLSVSIMLSSSIHPSACLNTAAVLNNTLGENLAATLRLSNHIPSFFLPFLLPYLLPSFLLLPFLLHALFFFETASAYVGEAALELTM